MNAARSAVEGAVVLDVVRLDVRDQHGFRGQLDERAVALVGLDDEKVATAVPHRTGADLVELAADDERRVQSGLDEHEREHRRGRRLPVSASHGHAALRRDDRREDLCAPQHGDAALSGRDDLGVRGRDRRRHRDHVDVTHVRGIVTDAHVDAEGTQPVEEGGALQVAPGHTMSHCRENRRDRAHSRATDPDDVHGQRRTGEVDRPIVSHAPAPRRGQRRAARRPAAPPPCMHAPWSRAEPGPRATIRAPTAGARRSAPRR